MSLTTSPIWPWPVLLVVAAGLVALVVWTYRTSVASQPGRWRHVVLGVRLLATALVLAALLRPALLFVEKKKQSALLYVLADRSRSMLVQDAWSSKSRWDALKQTLLEADPALKALGEDLEIKLHEFSRRLVPMQLSSEPGDQDNQTALGRALTQVLESSGGQRIAGVVLLSDGADTVGSPPPLAIARRLADLQVPLYTVGLGSDSISADTRDLSVRSLSASPLVFAKNRLNVSGDVEARAYTGQTVTLRLFFEDREVDRKTVTIEGDAWREQVQLSGVPQTPGELRVTLAIEPKSDELVHTNNSMSTFVTVQSGGLNVLYLEGKHRWEAKFISRSLEQSDLIELGHKALLPGLGRGAEPLPADVFEPGRHDVFIIGDLPADRLSQRQWESLRSAVQRGAGLLMVGGAQSFGPGGYGRNPLADVLPVEMHGGDGQIEGLFEMQPTDLGLAHFVMRLKTNATENRKAWESLPKLAGANQVGRLKAGARVLAVMSDGKPLLVAQEAGPSRAMAFAADTTWQWWMQGHQREHQQFWRQVILWLGHKDEAGDKNVWLRLSKRRLAPGEKLEVMAGATDEHGQPIGDAVFEATVESRQPTDKSETSAEGKEGASGSTPAAAIGARPSAGADAAPGRVELYKQGGEARGTYWKTDVPGEYTVSVAARRGTDEIGQKRARFLIYEQDVEMENPAANLGLLRSMAQTTGGQYVQPERLRSFLEDLKRSDLKLEVERTREERLWDRWPFFLSLVTLLAVEWFVRKRKGLP